MKKFIAIAGNMGVGKTSMVQFLCNTYDFEAVYEPFMDNPYLSDFYKNMKDWSFHSQLYFLTHKFRLHMNLSKRPKTVIQDRSIYEDAEIFARNLYLRKQMSTRDFNTYMELYDSMKNVLQPPDLMIYLRCSVKTIRKRIRQRGRSNEQQIPVHYIRNLNKLYENWIESYTLSPVLIWDADNMDYFTDMLDRMEFQRSIEKCLV